ncbi:DUF551 domain-containing protein [Citrobacter freundii]
MSPITKEFTKEQLQQIIETDHVQCGEASSLARIALASLKAEAVGEVIEQQSGMMMDGLVISEKPTYRNIKGIHKMKMMPLGTKFYTAPPAPANAEPVAWLWSHRKHPREVTLVRPEDDEKAEAALWSGWSCQALCAAPPAPVSVPAAMEMDDDFDSSFEHGKAVGWNAYRAAMLQGAEPVTTDYKLPFDQWLSQQTGTIDVECGCVMTEVFFHWLRVAYEAGKSPVIPDGWVACSERMPEKDDFVYIWPRPDFGVELHVAQYGKFDKRDAGWYAQVYEQNFGIEYHPITVTHWMPLPAAPQQEVK